VAEIERRKMERFSLELPAMLSVVNKSGQPMALEVKTDNICAGGAFFLTDTHMPVGTDVGMDLILSLKTNDKIEEKKTRIDIAGRVIRTDERGVAVCFDKKYNISPLNG
jgi:c-di-GMP-binding flagellar brake protein YcgR